MRYVAGCAAVGCLLWLLSMATHCINTRETVGELRITNSIQEKSLEEYKRQAEQTNDVLQQREEQRGIQDAARQKAARQLYEARENPKQGEVTCGLHTLDTPLPDSIAMPLRVQYQTLSASGQPHQDTTSRGAVTRTPPSRSAGTAYHQESGPLDK